MTTPLPLVSPLARRRATATGHTVSFLVWHDLVPRESDKLVWFDTPTALFDSQIAHLERIRARPIPLNDVYGYLSRGGPTPPPGAVVLCFDDNTVGIAEYAAPRLRKRNWPWVLSAHTGYVGVRTSKTHNDWDALRRLERENGATVVSQTKTHPPDLRVFADGPLQREMTDSRATMERELGHEVRYITYPSGKWDTQVARAAANAGYVLGLTEDFGPAEMSPHLLGIHRYSTHRRWSEAVVAITRSAKG